MKIPVFFVALFMLCASVRAAEKLNVRFIAVGFLKPHLPFCAPKKYWALSDRAKIEVPAFRSPPKDAPAFAPTTFGELRNYADTPEVGLA